MGAKAVHDLDGGPFVDIAGFGEGLERPVFDPNVAGWFEVGSGVADFTDQLFWEDRGLESLLIAFEEDGPFFSRRLDAPEGELDDEVDGAGQAEEVQEEEGDFWLGHVEDEEAGDEEDGAADRHDCAGEEEFEEDEEESKKGQRPDEKHIQPRSRCPRL